MGPSDQPRVRRSVLLALRETAGTELTPESHAAVQARLSGLALEIWRGATPLTQEWYDDTDNIAIVEGIHASISNAQFTAFVQKFCNNLIGRIRRLFLGLATPPMLAARAPEFWSYDHSTGAMIIEQLPDGVIVTLTDHPFTQSPACRALMTEYIRHTMSMTRARHIATTVLPDRDVLKLSVRWTT